jgi:DNA-binding PadR family transcriptional regulator
MGGMGRHFTKSHSGMGERRGGGGRRGMHGADHEGIEDEGRHPHGMRRGHRRGGRMFDYGELRLLVLSMIAAEPAHGYELIKAIEERLGGAYTPSPGVIYPTLSWLVDMGYASAEAEPSGRKRYSATPEGEAFLAANRAAADALLNRSGAPGHGRGGAPAPVARAMENLKTALRLRLRGGPVDETTAERIAAIIDEAAQTVEKL